ncbi:MAG: WYL domain-containing protein [Acidobacteria bacterium]|nr:WYL domain-containing protein [Acidobacteriota bacterium]MBI3657064.1 WYL domain-containing protein [Acidobacteriota bacterium]
MSQATLFSIDLNEITFCILDVETTGLNPALGDRICEIALLKSRNGHALDTYHTLVNPGRPISPSASAVNNISDAMVRNSPSFEDVAGDILSFMADTVLVGHNTQFDMSFLHAQLKALNLALPSYSVLDTLALARRHYKFASNSLGNVARAIGLEPENQHRALGDVLITKRIFDCFLKDFRNRGFATLEALLQLQGGSVAYPRRHDVVIPQILEDALKNRRRLLVKYVSAAASVSQRLIDPIEVNTLGDNLYLIGYCHKARDRRTFRLDRIIEMRAENRDE